MSIHPDNGAYVHHPPKGAVRQMWIGLFAAALMAGGVILALRALAFDSDMHERYRNALSISQAALETLAASADLRTWQARNVARLARGGDVPISAAELDELSARTADLRSRLDTLAAIDMPAESKVSINQLRSTLQRLERISRNSAAVGETGAAISRASLAEAAGDVDEFEHSLSALVAGASERASAMARQAEQHKAAARVGLIAFSAITLVLALVLTLLTLRTLRDNRELIERMSRLAQQDGLTGIANRRTLDEAVPVEFARARRSGQPLTLVMIDLDHFKRYNDRRGHAAGDALLRAGAQAWMKQMRPTDLLARYGGEEFTLVLPSCTADQAAQLVDRLRPLLPDRQTFSAGIATWDGEESMLELLQRSDRSLSQAKKGGRNRTIIAGRELQATLPLEVAATQ
jgi:diguanylate cyclase (GGDEF)-like protein